MGHNTSLFISLSRNNNRVAGGLTPPSPTTLPKNRDLRQACGDLLKAGFTESIPPSGGLPSQKKLKMIAFEFLPYFLYTNRHIRGEKAKIEAELVKTRKKAA
jgi:hypothetical protein